MPSILKNQIINWLQQHEYWFQYSGNLLLEGQSVSEELIGKTYKLLLEDLGLIERLEERPEVIFTEIPNVPESETTKLRLRLIKEVKNVNALNSGQVIEVNENLTIVYGANGSGKTGYVRLLNNAFISRGDKNILQNVFDENAKGEPTGSFVFQASGEPYTKVFPSAKGCSEFSKYAVFDTTCIRIHLENDNQLNFTPTGFDFFEKVLELFEEVKRKGIIDIAKNRTVNTFIPLFTNPNNIHDIIVNLGISTDEEKLKEFGNFTEENALKLEDIRAEIARLRDLNIPKQIAELEKIKRELSELMQREQDILNYLSPERIDLFQNLIESFRKYQALSKEQGIKSLELYDIELVGTKEWRDFIVSARSYATAVENNRNNTPQYPAENDHCLFCLQPLKEQENHLINTYWQFIKSEAERELNKIFQKIRDVISELKGLNPVKLDDSTLLYAYLITVAPDLLIRWETLVTETETAKQNLIINLKTQNIELPVRSFTENISELNPILDHIQTEIDDLIKKRPDKEIESLSIQMNFLSDKLLLSKLLSQVLDYVKALKWAQNAEIAISKTLRTNALTSFQGALFTEHITENYTTTFINECKTLNAPDNVRIVQHNVKLSTLRKLQVAGQTANRVLSEGEQNAISLADFLTEIQLNPNNTGVIFDDPVNSLDHLRKTEIANRIVTLAQNKQVIVFTHDLLFVNYLKRFSEVFSINFQCHWIERLASHPGVVSNNNSPATEGDYKTVVNADEAWKASRSAEPSEREKILKDGFASLRSNYEYFIIYELFQGVVLRFEERVSIDRLSKVIVMPEFTEKVINKVALLSRYIEAHLHSDKYGEVKPTSEDLKREIDDFISIKKELKEIRNNAFKE